MLNYFQNRPELVSVAMQAGNLLAKRLFSDSKLLMDYTLIAATLYSPLEYGTVGLSEEMANDQYGENNIEIYHSYYETLEFLVPQKNTKHCYLKVICLIHDDQKVLGMHFIGPNAGEVIQGFAAAMKYVFERLIQILLFFY